MRYTKEQNHHAKQYVAWVKSCRAAFRAGYQRVQYIWPHTDGITEAEFNQFLWVALNRRINTRGGIVLPDLEVQEIAWRRDQQRLRDIQNRIRVYQFESKEVRKHFRHLLSEHI